MPEDSEVTLCIFRSFVWRKKKKIEKDNSKLKIKGWKSGRKVWRKVVSLSNNSINLANNKMMKRKTRLKSVWLRQLRVPLKIEWKSISLCMILSVRRDKLSFFKCSLITKEKRSMNLRKWPDCIEEDWKELKKCLKRICKLSTAIWMKIKNRPVMPSKKQNFKLVQKTKKLQS